jgi:lipopolysaccharide export system permease protein
VRILDRYVLRETAVAAATATGGCIFVMVAGSVVRQIAGEVAAGRVNLGEAVELFGLLIPGVVPYALPLGMLTGVLIAFGRLGSQQELTAMKSGGIPLVRTALPAILLAACLALACCWINLEVAPRANTTYRAMLTGAASDNPAAAIVPGEFCRIFPGVVLRAGGRKDDLLTDLWVWQMDETGRVTQAVQARQARISRIPGGEGKSDLVRISAKDIRIERPQGTEENPRPSTHASLGDASFEFPLAHTESAGTRKLRWLTTSELFDAMETGWQVKPGATPRELTIARLEPLKQLNSHLASAVSVLTLSLLAVPLAVRVGRRETFVNAAVALGVALSFYVLSAMTAWAKAPEVHPELLIWVPNAVVLVAAVILLRRASRH